MTAIADTKRAPATWAGVSRDVLRDAYIGIAVLWTALVLAGVFVPNDGRLFWQYGRFPDPYAVTAYAAGAGFYYSPPLAVLLQPFTALPPQVLGAVITASEFGALWFLLGRYAILALPIPFVFWELWSGNVNLLIAAAAVAGFRYPQAWALALLTKVTPGIGLGWFVVRREWRSLALALGATLAVCAITLPWLSLWPAWIASLTTNAGAASPTQFVIPVPLVPRLAFAAGVVVVGAWRGWRWTVPLAAALAIPVLWLSAVSAFLGVLARRRMSG